MRTIEVSATIINIYPVSSEAVIVVFQTTENWILRGLAKKTFTEIESLVGFLVRIRYRPADGAELVNIEQVEVISDAED